MAHSKVTVKFGLACWGGGHMAHFEKPLLYDKMDICDIRRTVRSPKHEDIILDITVVYRKEAAVVNTAHSTV